MKRKYHLASCNISLGHKIVIWSESYGEKEAKEKKNTTNEFFSSSDICDITKSKKPHCRVLILCIGRKEWAVFATIGDSTEDYMFHDVAVTIYYYQIYIYLYILCYKHTYILCTPRTLPNRVIITYNMMRFFVHSFHRSFIPFPSLPSAPPLFASDFHLILHTRKQTKPINSK